MSNVLFSACRQIASPHRLNLRLVLPALLTVAFALPPAAQANAPAQITLTLSSSSVAWPAAVTLTASAAINSVPVTAGLIIFCNASAPVCEDAAVVGTAQLNSAGTATIKIIPAIGSHRYVAFSKATNAVAAGSKSNTQSLTVAGLYPTTTTVGATGNPSGYGLTATVTGFASEPPVLAGSITFQDTTNNNTVLGIVPLGPASFVQSYNPAPRSPVQTGASPAVAGVGDFNEDGKPDLAVVNAGDDTVSILLGNGDGTFALFATLPAIGTTPCASTSVQSNCSIAVGDFDGDGHGDLALTSGDDNTVTVLKGNGKGSFTPFSGSPMVVGDYPEAVKIGDFNLDGIQDLAVANADDNTVSILLGHGDGTFAPAGGSPVSTGVGSFPFFIAVGDFNHDNKDDLAITNGRDNTLSILEGNGDGTFTPFPRYPITLPNAAGTCPVVAADFNGDGVVDLAVANFNDDTVYVYLGNGDGSFTQTSQSPVTVGLNPFAMTALDYNGDGRVDLAVADFGYGAPTGTVDILVGDGAGSFALSAQSPITVGVEPNDVVAADFNGDGKPDLALPESGDTTTTILLNTDIQTATASLQNVILPGVGTHVVKASYPGDADFGPSFGTIDLMGLSIPTTLGLSASTTAQLVTLPVTFTAQLGPAASIFPTGTISFFDGGSLLAAVPINSAGQATYTTRSFADGVHSITASYSGDPIFPGSTSPGLSITISDLGVSRVGNNNTTVLPGTTVVYTLQVAPVIASTFLYNVTLSASGLPAGATATFSPATLTAGGKTATVTMTVATLKTASTAPQQSPFDRYRVALGILLPFLGTRAVRKRLRRMPPLLGVILLTALSLTALMGLSGCSGAGLFAARKVPYSITVIASEGNAGGTLQRSTGVPLAIQ